MFNRKRTHKGKLGSLKTGEGQHNGVQRQTSLKIQLPSYNTPSNKHMRLISGSKLSADKLNQSLKVGEEENFSNQVRLAKFEHEEIKEEAECSSSKRECASNPRPVHWHRNLQSSKLLPGSVSELVNPFVYASSQSESKKSSGGTPGFQYKTKSNVFSFKKFRQCRRKDSVDYNEPSRYLYEFFTHKKFSKFRDTYVKYMRDQGIDRNEEDKVKAKKVYDNQRKHLFMEIKNTLILIKSRPHNTLPLLCEINQEKAEQLGCSP